MVWLLIGLLQLSAKEIMIKYFSVFLFLVFNFSLFSISFSSILSKISEIIESK